MIYDFAARPNYMPWLAGPLVTLKPRMTIKRIQEAVAAYYGIRLHEMLSDRRAVHVAIPRQVAMYLARELTLQSLPSIGRLFNRDHTTVHHACHAIARRIEEQPRIAADVKALRQELVA